MAAGEEGQNQYYSGLYYEYFEICRYRVGCLSVSDHSSAWLSQTKQLNIETPGTVYLMETAMIERAFIIVFSILIIASNSNAAQILIKKASPSGETRWHIQNPKDPAVNCPQEVKSALNKMLTIFNDGPPDQLAELFAPKTVITGETQLFDNSPQTASQSVADMIDSHKKIRKLFDNYQYFQLRGSCIDSDDKVIYKGSDLEIYAATNKRPIFGYSTVTYEFRKVDYKIIHSYAKGKISHQKQ